MNIAPILDADGEPYFMWGGAGAWKTGSAHGWLWALEWVKINNQVRRCLIVAPESRVQFGNTRKTGAWCISSTALLEMFGVNENGKATGVFAWPKAEAEIKQGLAVMGREPTTADIRSLADAILAVGMSVFYDMPAAPPAVKKTLASAPMWDIQKRAKSSGKILEERTI